MTAPENRTEQESHIPEPLPKVATGMPGLDEVLNGGFPRGRTTLLAGGPGSGKTLMGMEFLYRSALQGQAGIMISFEERAENLRRNALSLGWDLAPLEKAGKLFLLEARVDHKAVISGDFNINGLLAIIEGKARSMGATLLVIDAIDVLMHMFEEPKRQQDEMYALHKWLDDRDLTVVLTSKRNSEAEAGGVRFDMLDYMADCVVLLDLRVVAQVTTRRLRVVKYRGSGFGSNEYPYVITETGNVVIPISRTALAHRFLSAMDSSGNPQLDVLLGGGYRRGSSVLIAGASGTGKTTLACSFAAEACRQGRKTLYISFEESQEAIVSTMLSPGIDIRPGIKDGLLEFMTIMPEAVGADWHLIHVLGRMDAIRPEHVIVDAVSALKRMGGEQAAFGYLIRLVDACKSRKITCLMTNQFSEQDEIEGFTKLAFSSLIDTAVLLAYSVAGGQITRRLLVSKSRGVNHSNRYHQLLITGKGVVITDCRRSKRVGVFHDKPV